LIAYRKAVEALPKGATRDCLLAALLLGGQRLAQLARALALFKRRLSALDDARAAAEAKPALKAARKRKP
jgi:hypothetical protein